jgi:predicted DNA-binding transcriptional regulator AlpA
LHLFRSMDLKNLISRIEIAALLGIEPQTVRKWTSLGIFPEPKLSLSDRVILYDRDEVHRAIEERKRAKRLRVAPKRRSA